MALESAEKIKVLDAYIEILKQELLFSMAEGKPENMNRIIAIKLELDKAAQQKMRLSQIYHSSIGNGIALTVPIG